MVQGGSRNTSTGVALTNQDKKHEKPEAHTTRKALPSKRKPIGFYDKHNHAVTSTIGRNIETVMAARLVHEGGRLTVLPMPENVDKFDTSRARISSRQMADLKRATKARMGRQQRDGTNTLVDAKKNPKKSKSNKLGPKKGYVGVDSDDEEYKKIKEGDDEEIIPRDDVLTPDTSDDESPEGLERKAKSAERHEALQKKLLETAESLKREREELAKKVGEKRKAKMEERAAKRRKVSEGADDEEDSNGDDEDEEMDESKEGGEDDDEEDDNDDEDDDESDEELAAPRKKVKTHLDQWLADRAKKSGLGLQTKPTTATSSTSSTTTKSTTSTTTSSSTTSTTTAAPKPKPATSSTSGPTKPKAAAPAPASSAAAPTKPKTAAVPTKPKK